MGVTKTQFLYIYIYPKVIGKNLAVFQAESDQFENGSWSGQTSGFPILRIVDQYFGVSVVCWFMTLSNYSYSHHKPSFMDVFLSHENIPKSPWLFQYSVMV